MAVVEITDEVRGGTNFTFTFNLQKDGSQYTEGDLTGATIVTSIRKKSTYANLLDDIATTFVAATAVATLALTPAQTRTLAAGDDGSQTFTCIGDVKITESGGDVFLCGPFEFPVRAAID